MIFRKIQLDESVIDDFDTATINDSDEVDWEWDSTVKNTAVNDQIYDDDFSAPDYMPAIDNEKVFDMPEDGTDIGISDAIIAAINSEWESIREYNSLVATIHANEDMNPEYTSFVDVITDIVNEENKHVGQLQQILKQISPTANSIEAGEVEGESQLRFVNGKLPVQSAEPLANSSSVTPNHVEDMCTIDNIDDEL